MLYANEPRRRTELNQRIILNRREFAAAGTAGMGALLLPRGLPAAKPGNKLKLLSYNVWYGFTKKPKRK
ncbi:MAG: hypothetical protein GY892_09175, partial [Shimia sp.]|nr:hypothetical protein [Shimia sp.]